MSDIAKIIGERILNQRKILGLTQEQLAEKCKLHNTYIGQLERGEKNATLESIEKVVHGLDISFETLFQNISTGTGGNQAASECYQLISGLNEDGQKDMLEIVRRTIEMKNK